MKSFIEKCIDNYDKRREDRPLKKYLVTYEGNEFIMHTNSNIKMVLVKEAKVKEIK